MDGKIDKRDAFLWACGVMREAVENGAYGSITFSMQNGTIGNAKREIVLKPGIDSKFDKA